MYIKLILRNAIRSAKDYIIYIMTLTLCVSMFYAFLSITSRYFKPDLGAEFSLEILGAPLKASIALLTLLMLYLVNYVNRYMIKRRMKEFALQTIMGMERAVTSRLFLAETLLMGALSIGLGIVLGAFLSQLITALMLSSYGKSYHIMWTLFPDTALFCTVFFLICFLAAGAYNSSVIKRIPITQMLSENRRNEDTVKKSRFMPVMSALYIAALLWMTDTAVYRVLPFYDSRHPFAVKLMMFGVTVMPIASLVAALAYSVAEFAKNRKAFRFYGLVAMLLAFVPFVAAALLLVPLEKLPYFLPITQDTLTVYLADIAVCFAFAISAVVCLASVLLTRLKNRKQSSYRGENLFFYGQLLSTLKTAVKSMSLIGITLAFSIGIFMAEPLLVGWAEGYLEMRSVFDVQICSFHNQAETIEDIHMDSYDECTRFLEEKGVELTANVFVVKYLPLARDFHNRRKYDFPVGAISLSDYNALRKMQGEEAVSLGESEFLMQWRQIADYDTALEYAGAHGTVETDAGKLTLAEDGIYYAPLGESIYNSYTDVLYVFPDSVCGRLLPVSGNRFMMSKEPIPYETAAALEEFFRHKYGDDLAFDYIIRTRSEQMSTGIATNFTLKLAMIYGAVILMLSCVTILALQQLSEADRFGYRFDVLKKLGVPKERINGLIMKQIAFWFGLPVAAAVVAAGVFEVFVCASFWTQVKAYIGAGALLSQLCATVVILAVLLGCYFMATWILFRRAVE